MSTSVMKFGGASVSKPENFLSVAELIKEKLLRVDRVVVVVSAMSGMTDHLIDLAKIIHPDPPRRELDMLISTGERMSSALLAMALAKIDIQAVSLTGSQAGIVTSSMHSEARIIDVKPHRLLGHFEKKKVVIIAGFQGVTLHGEITTLGRGGSDTTAVAIGVALKTDHIELYKDVGGMYNADPKVDPNAALHPYLDFDRAQEILLKGAKILSLRSLLLAKKNQLPLHILPFDREVKKKCDGTIIGNAIKGEEKICLYEEEDA